MSASDPLERTVEHEVDLGLATVAIVAERYAAPFEVNARNLPMHHLQFAMRPFARPSVGRFTEFFDDRRFERMGEVFLFPASTVSHIMVWCEVQRSIVCSFDPEIARDRLGWDFDWTEDGLARCLDIANPEVRRLLSRIGSELESPRAARPAMLQALVTQTLVELARYYRGEGRSKGGLSPWRLRIVEEVIARDPGHCNVHTIAGLCGLSVRQLSRAFHASRGQTLLAYITGRRLQLAREMLRAGASIKETAYATGFTAASNFSTAFQRETGCPPSEFRARNSN